MEKFLDNYFPPERIGFDYQTVQYPLSTVSVTNSVFEAMLVVEHVGIIVTSHF